MSEILEAHKAELFQMQQSQLTLAAEVKALSKSSGNIANEVRALTKTCMSAQGRMMSLSRVSYIILGAFCLTGACFLLAHLLPSELLAMIQH